MRQSIIVTGASRGLGAAICQSAAKLGANVVMNARSIPDLKTVIQESEERDGMVLAVPGDVSLEADCRRIVDRAVSTFGRIDALVNNAAIVEPIAPISSTKPADWERNWAVNVLGPMM
jgi:NAD(P)-dependent dehydrogenase (short-subunit alcohol dehydrogenase family)